MSEGKPIILITLQPSVDITKFLYLNESYVVKDGVRTTTIRPEGKKEKVIKVTGLHPNTMDLAVIKYLSAHGTVSSTDKVIHHVFPGVPGSSLCAGKLNGDRSYVVDLKVPMGSYHIVDGEKVSVRYTGQEWTCARCHQYKKYCPGSAVARDCTASRVLLSDYMLEHWAKIGYKPETDALNEVDGDVEPTVQVGKRDKNEIPVAESSLTSKYRAVIIKGFRNDSPLEDIFEILAAQGLPSDYNKEHITRNENTGHLSVESLSPQDCLALSANMNSKRFLNRQIHVTSVVADSPKKIPEADPKPKAPPALVSTPILDPQTSSPTIQAKDSVQTIDSLKPLPPNLGELLTLKLTTNPIPETPTVQDKINQLNLKDKTPLPSFKRKGSPDTSELSRKEKKIQRETEKKQRKAIRREEFRQNCSLDSTL